MSSKYGYVLYMDDIKTVEVNKDGNMVQLNEPSFKGQIDLLSSSECARLSADFPNKIKSGEVAEANLINMISFLYDKLKADYATIPTKNRSTEIRFQEFQYIYDYVKKSIEVAEQFKEMPEAAQAFGIKLDNTDAINDLANKFYILQREVRQEEIKAREIGAIMATPSETEFVENYAAQK